MKPKCAISSPGPEKPRGASFGCTIRPTALGRKNWLFYGSEAAGQHNAALLSVVQSCRMLGVPLSEYLHELLEALPRLTQQEAADWTPARWLARRAKQEAA
jgi:transposase